MWGCGFVGFLPSTMACLVQSLLSSCFSIRVGKHLCVYLLAFLRGSLTENSLLLWVWQSFFSLFYIVPWPLGTQVFCRSIHWDWPPKLTFLLVVVFCNDLYLLQRKVSLMRGKDFTYLWYKDKYLECSWGLCWFNKGVAVCSPLIAVTSLALGFQYEARYCLLLSSLSRVCLLLSSS